MTADAELPAGVPGIDVPRLAAWLARELPGTGRITAVDLIAGGRSNLTYGITLDGGRRIVLRRPPLGHVLPTAHDMGREYRVLSALGGGTAVPVPATLAFCDDEDVIGARFHLMDFVEGRVLRTREDAADITPERARGSPNGCRRTPRPGSSTATSGSTTRSPGWSRVPRSRPSSTGRCRPWATHCPISG